jgi:hypothetical protein
VTDCDVRKDDPIYTGLLGDCESDILVVGETPSASDLKNDPSRGTIQLDCGGPDRDSFDHPHLGGYSRNITENGKSPLGDFLTFIRSSCLIEGTKPGPWPWFTDLVKCGVPRQSSKRILRIRQRFCVPYLLVDEIAIIQPRIIACVGKVAFQAVRDLLAKGMVAASTRVLYFLHYSRSAGLTVTVDEKRDILWPLQAGCVPPEERCRELGKIRAIGEIFEGAERFATVTDDVDFMEDDEG